MEEKSQVGRKNLGNKGGVGGWRVKCLACFEEIFRQPGREEGARRKDSY